MSFLCQSAIFFGPKFRDGIVYKRKCILCNFNVNIGIYFIIDMIRYTKGFKHITLKKPSNKET